MRTIRKAREGGEKDRRQEEIELSESKGAEISHIYPKNDLKIYTRGMISDPCSHRLSGIERAVQLNGEPDQGTRIRHVQSSNRPWFKRASAK